MLVPVVRAGGKRSGQVRQQLRGARTPSLRSRRERCGHRARTPPRGHPFAGQAVCQPVTTRALRGALARPAPDRPQRLEPLPTATVAADGPGQRHH